MRAMLKILVSTHANVGGLCGQAYQKSLGVSKEARPTGGHHGGEGLLG